MRQSFTLGGIPIFDGRRWRREHVLRIADGHVAEIAEGEPDIRLEGGFLTPGFVDLQVNGGGGVLFNDETTPEAIAAICRAHGRFGTTALLPTLITDERHKTEQALTAVAGAIAQGVPGCLGIHLEGPYLNPLRKGAHEARFLRVPDERDFAVLGRASFEHRLMTLAPEMTGNDAVRRMVELGWRVSIGHSEARFNEAAAAAEAGATCVTHLYNAMAPLAGREPGVLGAALGDGRLSAGLIADGHHVHVAAIRTALAAKQGPGRLFLVTDAMPPLGSDIQSFELNGRTIYRREGRLSLADGTLAGADLDMMSAVRFMVRNAGLALDEALRMATLYPAEAIGAAGARGRLGPGARADMVHVRDDLTVAQVWIGGVAQVH